MKIKKNIGDRILNYGYTGISRKLLYTILFIYLLSYMMEGKLASLLILTPTDVIDKFDFWRILTYPFAYGSILGIVFSLIVFYYIAPKFEDFLSHSLFPVLLLLITCIHGLAHILIFWKNPVQMAGLESLSIFILTSYGLIEYSSYIKISFLPPIKVIVLAPLLISLWIVIKIINSFSLGYLQLFNATSSLILGITTGIIFYFYYKIIDNKIKHKKLKQILKAKEEPEYASYQSRATQYHSIDEEDSLIEDDIELNEEKLNHILDKINEIGKDSLSRDEIKFLKDYSKRI